MSLQVAAEQSNLKQNFTCISATKEIVNEVTKSNPILISPIVENTQGESKSTVIGSDSLNNIPKQDTLSSHTGHFIPSHYSLLAAPESPIFSKTLRRPSNCRNFKNNCFKTKPHYRRKVSPKACTWSDATSSISSSSAPGQSCPTTDVEKSPSNSGSLVDLISEENIPRLSLSSNLTQYKLMTLESTNIQDIPCQEDLNGIRKSNGTNSDKFIASRSLSPEHLRNCDTKSESKFSTKTDLTTLAACKGRINLTIICQFSRITILLKEAQSLRSMLNKVCNPFVRIQLVSSNPNSLNIPLFDTEVFSNSNSPVFDKSFSFNISQLDYHKRIVLYTYHVQENDIELLGSMSFGIRKFLNKTQISGWYYLLKQEIGCKKHLRASCSSVSSLFSNSHSTLSDSTSFNNKMQTGCQIFEAKLYKGQNGFGFTLCGGSPVYISHVDVDSSAEVAGIHPGDMIIKIDNFNISQSSTEAVVRMFRMCSKSVKVTVLRSPGHQNFRPLPPVPITMHPSKTFPCIHTLSSTNLTNAVVYPSCSSSQPSKCYDSDVTNIAIEPQWDSNNQKSRFDSKSVHFKSKAMELESTNYQRQLRTSQSATSSIFDQTQGDKNQCLSINAISTINNQSRIPGEGCSNPPKSPSTVTGKGIISRLQYQGHLKKVDFSQNSSNLELYGIVSLKEGNCLFPVHLYLFQQVLLIGQQEPDGYITVIKEPIYCSKICYANIPAFCKDELILQYINEVGRKQFIHIQATNIKEWLCRIQRFMVYNCNWWMTNVA